MHDLTHKSTNTICLRKKKKMPRMPQGMRVWSQICAKFNPACTKTQFQKRLWTSWTWRVPETKTSGWRINARTHHPISLARLFWAPSMGLKLYIYTTRDFPNIHNSEWKGSAFIEFLATVGAELVVSLILHILKVEMKREALQRFKAFVFHYSVCFITKCAI